MGARRGELFSPAATAAHVRSTSTLFGTHHEPLIEARAIEPKMAFHTLNREQKAKSPLLAIADVRRTNVIETRLIRSGYF